jgi:3-oxoacyl-[acyl-carrier protein] reductase
MLFNMTDDEWDDVLRVHLTGAFGTTRAACRWWRAEAKAGRGGYGRIVNTATGLLLYGGAGQSNYTAAKAGVVGFTESIAMEMAPYGVTANAIMPSARTRLAGVGWRMAQLQEEATDTYDPTDPCHVAAMVCYLATPAAGWVSGQTFQVRGGIIEHVQTFEPDRTLARDDAGWSVGDLVAEMPRMFGAGTRRPMPPPKEWQDQYHARGAPATAEPAGAAGR